MIDNVTVTELVTREMAAPTASCTCTCQCSCSCTCFCWFGLQKDDNKTGAAYNRLDVDKYDQADSRAYETWQSI